MSNIVRRNVDPEFRRKNDKNILQLNHLKAEYEKSKTEVDKCEKILNAENDQLSKATALAEDARNKLSEAQEAIDCDPLPEGAQPRARIQQRDSLLLNANQLEASLIAQKKASQDAFQRLMDAEKKLFQSERDLNQFASTLEDTMVAISTIEALDKDKADRLKKVEDTVKKRKERERKAQEAALEAQTREMNELNARREAEAKRLNKQARAKLAQSNALTYELSSKIAAVNEATMQDRTEAVLELKANLTAVRAEVAGLAEKHVRKMEMEQKQLEDEKEDMIAKGLNPYVEFRKKKLSAEAEAREARLRDAVEQNKVELAQRMKKEQRYQDKRDAEVRKAREYEKKHRESQGKHVVEERNRNYIVSRTAGGMEILDPTGKLARVDPSQVTDIPDYSFGLGKSARIPKDSMKRITEQIRDGLRVDREDLGEYERLVTGLKKKTGTSEAEDAGSDAENDLFEETGGKVMRSQSAPQKDQHHHLEQLAARTGVVPGTDRTSTVINLDGNELEKQQLLKIAVEAEGDINKSSGVVTSPGIAKYPAPVLSKFERDALDRAKERHKDRIEHGMEQVAGGRVFSGQGFVSKPAELLFKDFEVGRKMKKRFTMTNASYTFNSFKLLDLDDDVIDFFTITFEKPGRMSAGMSCWLDIEFSPQINQDIFTQVRFFTETGPVQVPLTCLIRRCAPRIATDTIDFGPVVMGQVVQVPLKIVNSQAIPTSFTIASAFDDAESLLEPVEPIASGRRDSKQGKLEGDAEALEDPIAFSGEDVALPSSEPAINEAELAARVRQVMTAVLRQKKRENPTPLSCKATEGRVDGYHHTQIVLTCAPLAVGPAEQKISLHFDSVDEAMQSVDEAGRLITKEQVVTLRTVGEEVPIYVDEEVLDLRCTLFDRIYRSQVELKNRGKTAFRVMVKIAPAFSSFVEANPTMFFIQAKSSQSVNLKFVPTKDILSKLSFYSLPYDNFADAALLQLPIEIQVVNQELPVYFILKASVCPSTVVLSTAKLDFGRIYVGQKSTQKVSLRNVSMLPQKIGFIRLRKEFSIQPNDGFGVLLPGEEMEYEVSFSPQSAVSYEMDIALLTSFNDSYSIKVCASGVDPPIELSTSVIHMRSTAPGQRVLESTFVRNTTQRKQCFEILVPDKCFSWLSVSPTVMVLNPGERGRLEIEYLPPENAMDLSPLSWHDEMCQVAKKASPEAESPFGALDAKDGWVYGSGMYGSLQWTDPNHKAEPAMGQGEGSFDSLVQQEKDDWGVIGKWHLPLLLKPRKLKSSAEGLGTTIVSPDSSPVRSSGAPLSPTRRDTSAAGVQAPAPLFLSIVTVMNRPQLDADQKLIDFGQVSIGTRLIRTFKVFNRGFESIRLNTVGFNASGPFTLIRPIREIAPGESDVVIVECIPAVPGLIVEILEIFNAREDVGGHRLRITMKVQGLKPTVKLEGLSAAPSNWPPGCGILDFQNVLATETIVKKFSIRNCSTFTIDARIVRIVGAGLPPVKQSELLDRAAAGYPIFSIRPETVQIPRDGVEEIEVTFRPDRGRFQPFREDVEVIVGQTEEKLQVGLIGRSSPRQYLVLPDNPLDESFRKPQYDAVVEDALISSHTMLVRNSSVEARASLKLKTPEVPLITLEFPDPFAANANPATYTTVDNSAANKKGAPPPKGAPAATSEARQQTRRIVISSTKFGEGKAPSAGSYEVLLSAAAKESGLWVLSSDKGSLTPNGPDVPIDIICTLPKPRNLGGMSVGCWKTFSVDVIVKGGVNAAGEGEEMKTTVVLKAYVSI